MLKYIFFQNKKKKESIYFKALVATILFVDANDVTIYYFPLYISCPASILKKKKEQKKGEVLLVECLTLYHELD